MKKKLTISLLSFLFLSAIATSSSFANHGAGHCSMSEHGTEKCSSGGCSHESSKSQCPIARKVMAKAHWMLENKTTLGLSDEQVKTIEDLKTEMKKKQIRESAEMQISMMDMEAKLKEEKVDVNGLNKMIDQGMASMAQSAKENVQAYAKLKGMLSDDQWKKLKESKHSHG